MCQFPTPNSRFPDANRGFPEKKSYFFSIPALQMHLYLQSLMQNAMTTNDVFIWSLLDQSPFLRSYLEEIESKKSTDQTVWELITFFRELEEMMDIVAGNERKEEKLSVFSHQFSASQKEKNNKEKELI